MNFLAHLVLAPQTPEGLIGSIAPDMIRGPLPSGLHEAVLAAAKEHQRIDQFTDAHRVFIQTRERLCAVVDRRLAGILADVLYDYVLARGWGRWRGDDLLTFVAETEQSLLDSLHHVPVQMQMIVRKMTDEHWLASYATSSGIRARLETMSLRLSARVARPMSLRVTEQELAGLFPSLVEDFSRLWPDLVAYVDQNRDRPIKRLAC